MENKINIAELLKDFPKGAKLYSPLCGECTFQCIHSELKKILISTSDGATLTFHYNGTYYQMDNSECLLFPSKDQRDWRKFQRPFMDGDILVDISGDIYICKIISTYNYCGSYASINSNGVFISYYTPFIEDSSRYATEEEKQKLFDAIKANGYKWDPETKTLENLPKFKVGDRVVKKDGISVPLSIRWIGDKYYYFNRENSIEILPIAKQDDYELDLDKFDITTLKPFESKVLVRDNKLQKWAPAMWGYYDFDSQDYPYKLVGGAARYCIPYEGNKHLLGTTDDCDDFYKTW